MNSPLLPGVYDGLVSRRQYSMASVMYVCLADAYVSVLSYMNHRNHTAMYNQLGSNL